MWQLGRVGAILTLSMHAGDAVPRTRAGVDCRADSSCRVDRSALLYDRSHPRRLTLPHQSHNTHIRPGLKKSRSATLEQQNHAEEQRCVKEGKGTGGQASTNRGGSSLTHTPLRHAHITGKGGKNRRRGKNDNEETKRDLIFKEDGQGGCLACLMACRFHGSPSIQSV